MADDRAMHFFAQGANAFKVELTASPGAEPLFAPIEKAAIGIHARVRVSHDLQAIVGAEFMPRSEVVSKVWTYIKEKGLQDKADRRQINADARLEKVLGTKRASMFEMNKRLSAHLEKVGGSDAVRVGRHVRQISSKKA